MSVTVRYQNTQDYYVALAVSERSNNSGARTQNTTTSTRSRPVRIRWHQVLFLILTASPRIAWLSINGRIAVCCAMNKTERPLTTLPERKM